MERDVVVLAASSLDGWQLDLFSYSPWFFPPPADFPPPTPRGGTQYDLLNTFCACSGHLFITFPFPDIVFRLAKTWFGVGFTLFIEIHFWYPYSKDENSE